MSRWDAWMVHLSTLLVGGSGLVYAWMRYLAEPADPYAVVGHPWQPAVQHLHVWSAPLLVFAAGLIWRQHVWLHWRRAVRPGRRSGVALMSSLAPMLASGYLIQTAVEEGWRTAWVWIHLVTASVWLVGYCGHAGVQLGRWWRRAASEGGARKSLTADAMRPTHGAVRLGSRRPFAGVDGPGRAP